MTTFSPLQDNSLSGSEITVAEEADLEKPKKHFLITDLQYDDVVEELCQENRVVRGERLPIYKAAVSQACRQGRDQSELPCLRIRCSPQHTGRAYFNY